MPHAEGSGDGNEKGTELERGCGDLCRPVPRHPERARAESVAFLSTGQLPFEELALLGAVAKFGMGIRHGDGNTRQCMASAVVAYKQSFGFDAPGFTYTDIEQSDCLIFLGANPAIAHPILWQRLKNNTLSPAVVVIDPRLTESAKEATHYLAIEPQERPDPPLYLGPRADRKRLGRPGLHR